MHRIFITLLVVLSVPPELVPDEPYGGLKLLEGYKFERSHTSDSINGIISKEGGLRIEFESGISEGYAVQVEKKATYIWYQEQVANGHRVMVALTKPDDTKWRPQKSRKPKRKQILMVTFPGKFGPMDAANFYAEVLNEGEVAEMLLMVLTFDPDK